MFSLNDLQPKMWVFERRKAMLANLAQRSYAASLLAVCYWELRFLLTGHDDRAPYRDKVDEHPGWSMVEAAMAEISALCKKNGIPFVLFARDHRRLQSLADRAGFTMVNLEKLSDSRRKGADLIISPTNRHPNRLGIEMNSTLIRESLQRLNLFSGGPVS